MSLGDTVSKEDAKQLIDSNLKNTIYEFQYKMRLPFRYVFFTKLGMISILVSYFVFDDTGVVVGAELLLAYPIYKYFTPLKNYEIHKLPIYQISKALSIWFNKVINK